jgi:hypothetical protein
MQSNQIRKTLCKGARMNTTDLPQITCSSADCLLTAVPQAPSLGTRCCGLTKTKQDSFSSLHQGNPDPAGAKDTRRRITTCLQVCRLEAFDIAVNLRQCHRAHR